MGYASGIALAATLTILAINTRIGAWRTLIAVELIFGVSSGKGGLGWFIFENRNLLDIPAVFAGLFTRDRDRPRGGKPYFPHHRAQHDP